MYRKFRWQVDAYESKKQELVAENADLRALLRSMQVCHHGLVVAICEIHKSKSCWSYLFLR